MILPGATALLVVMTALLCLSQPALITALSVTDSHPNLKNPWVQSNVAVSYNAHGHQDGAGAQLHRVLGIYAIAKFLNIRYVHTLPIIRDFGLLGIETPVDKERLRSRWTSYLAIKSTTMINDTWNVVQERFINISSLAGIAELAEKQKRPVLIKVTYPYHIVERHPEMYAVLQPPISTKQDLNAVVRVAIHIRRGDTLFQDPSRLLDNSYYINVARNLGQVLKTLELPYVVEVHTEVPLTNFTVTPEMRPGLAKSVQVSTNTSFLEELHGGIPGMVLHLNKDPVWTMLQMSSADIFVMSRSSYSYVASLLSPKGVILCPPNYWSLCLPSWFPVDMFGNFATSVADELKKRFKSIAK